MHMLGDISCLAGVTMLPPGLPSCDWRCAEMRFLTRKIRPLLALHSTSTACKIVEQTYGLP